MTDPAGLGRIGVWIGLDRGVPRRFLNPNPNPIFERTKKAKTDTFLNPLTPVLAVTDRPIPIVLVKCWKVAHWNAKKLLKNCQKSKKLLPKFQKLLPKFLAIFI